MSTAAGTPTNVLAARGTSADMLDPVLVPVDLATHDAAVLRADRQRDGPRARDLPVVHRADRRDLGGGSAHEHLLGDVDVAARQLAELHVEAEVVGDRDHGALGD